MIHYLNGASCIDEYVCIKEALRNYERKPQVTKEDLKQVEKEQKEKYKKFLEEEKQGEQ